MKTEAPADVQSLINSINATYETVHTQFEDNFWSTKMGLKGNSIDELAKTKSALDTFLGDSSTLNRVREAMKAPEVTADQEKVLKLFEKTFLCYITEDPAAKELKEQLNVLEAELGAARGGMNLGYKDPQSGEWVKSSSVQLRNVLRVNEHEETRKAAYEAMRSIGPFVAEKFLQIVKLRNRLARLQGYQDFYDLKVTQAEGFGKTRLFEILDDLEQKTRPIMAAARSTLAQEKGEAALQPFNMSFALAGDTEKLMDPYFPFEDAVDVWARTFAALDIKYRGSTMRLDLCDREGKYSNGFCHWPQVAWRKPDGTLVPSQANFTSLATPSDIGSGKTALETLLHEGGHAAHFANIDQPSPLFAQERAPTSVAYAENQSMFLDSLVGDAAWLGRYALNREGEPIPWEVIETRMKMTRPYSVFGLRAMIAVPYFEKVLYETPEDQLTVDNLLKLADEVEVKIQGGLTPRPLLSVPHMLTDESACYYHGYVLAEMSVHQTRAHFKAKYGKIVDNPKVGQDLAEVYWRPGNGAAFLDLVKQLTGRPLAADAWVAELERPIATMLAEERKDYDAAVAAGAKIPAGAEADLGMRVILVHGDEVISDSQAGGFAKACGEFKGWVRQQYFGSAPASAAAV